MDLDELMSIQDAIIVIIVLIFHYLLDLLLSEDSCKYVGVWDRVVGASGRQLGIKSVV